MRRLHYGLQAKLASALSFLVSNKEDENMLLWSVSKTKKMRTCCFRQLVAKKMRTKKMRTYEHVFCFLCSHVGLCFGFVSAIYVLFVFSSLSEQFSTITNNSFSSPSPLCVLLFVLIKV